MSDSGEFVAPAVEQPVAGAAPEVEAAEKVKEEEEGKKEEPAKEEKKPRERKPRQAKAVTHPPYFQMIKDAITALNEKSGSSPYAIAKYIEEKHKPVLPVNFRKILALQLKNSAARGKLVKVRASYKLSQAGKREAPLRTTNAKPTQKTTTTKAARANAAKPEETITKAKSKRSKRARSKSVNQIESKMASNGATTRRTRKLAPATKPRQPKSIKKKAKKGAAA